MLFLHSLRTYSSCTFNNGERIVRNIESNIREVLVGDMPFNSQISQSRITLVNMINSLPEDSIVLSYLNDKTNISYIFKAINSPTKADSSGERVLEPNEKHTWLNLNIFEFPETLGGTYCFIQNNNNEVYIGSCVSHRDRLFSHKKSFSENSKNPKSLHTSQIDLQESLTFSIVHLIPSLHKMFRL